MMEYMIFVTFYDQKSILGIKEVNSSAVSYMKVFKNKTLRDGNEI